MDFRYVSLEVKNKIAYVTVTREEAMNALNLEVINDLQKCFMEIEQSKKAGVVIITGKGRAFIAGADIAQLGSLRGIEGRSYPGAGQKLMNYIEDFDLPVIAAINGFALGGGNELAMACDIRIASIKARFGQPEVNLGIIPGYGGSQRLTRLVGKGMSKYLILTGETIGAEEAYRIGLVQKITEPERLMAEAEKIANMILSKAPIAVQLSKVMINAAGEVDTKSGVLFEKEAFGAAFNTADREEGIDAFMNKRPARFNNR